MKAKRLKNKWLLISLLFAIVASAELPSDKTAKLYITSDTAELNKLTGISIFTGNVKVDHGSTHVTANKLTTYSDQKNQVVKAIAEGSEGQLATYQTMTAPNKPPVNAKALVIKYFPQRHYVILIGQANAVQGTNSIQGPRLEYDLTNQLLITKNVAGANGGRTEIVIQPDDAGS